MLKQYSGALCWFRRDLRSGDHAALFHALKNSRRVFCVFVFDRDILSGLPDTADRRVEFIWRSVRELQQALQDLGGGLIVRHGRAVSEIPELVAELGVQALFFNRDYEPEAGARDAEVRRILALRGVACHDFKDQVIFDHNEVLAGTGRPYNMFTPYRNAWLKRLEPFFLKPYPVQKHAAALAACSSDFPGLAQLGFQPAVASLPAGMSGARRVWQDFQQRIDHYHEQRDFPAANGTSRLSAHLRFGTLSTREIAGFAHFRPGPGPQAWLNELIWREFYQMLLYHHPRVADQAFRVRHDRIAWPGSEAHFAAWCAGMTGYPLVDAAMRQLNQSGYMHNRLRMVAASFLVKDLHVDWKKGERYFARQLLDYDLAANNGGWQWAASTGCDAQPWFRIFNPVTQSERFDPEGRFIRAHVPELASCDPRFIHAPWKMPLSLQQASGIVIGRDYPAPLVDHATAREVTLALFRPGSS